MNELRVNDKKLTKEMFDAVLRPTEILNVLTKKLKLYNEIEATLKESRNKLIVGLPEKARKKAKSCKKTIMAKRERKERE